MTAALSESSVGSSQTYHIYPRIYFVTVSASVNTGWLARSPLQSFSTTGNASAMSSLRVPRQC